MPKQAASNMQAENKYAMRRCLPLNHACAFVLCFTLPLIAVTGPENTLQSQTHQTMKGIQPMRIPLHGEMDLTSKTPCGQTTAVAAYTWA
jgi:hypothetical protein